MKKIILIFMVLITISACVGGQSVKIKIVDMKNVNDPDCGCIAGNSSCYYSYTNLVTIVQDNEGRSDKWCGYFGPVGYEFSGFYRRTIGKQLHMK